MMLALAVKYPTPYGSPDDVSVIQHWHLASWITAKLGGRQAARADAGLLSLPEAGSSDRNSAPPCLEQAKRPCIQEMPGN